MNQKMKAIILAAGMGKRTKEYGESNPKCLFEFQGKTTLEHQLTALQESNIKDIVIVVGYKKNQIIEFIKKHNIFSNELNITFVENPLYETTNTSYSWWLAREHVKDTDILIHLNSDLIFFPDLIKELINDKHENMIVTDNEVELNDSMEQVIIGSNGRIIFMDKANVPGANGKGAGISKFSRKTIAFILDQLNDYIINKNDKNQNFYGILRNTVKHLEFYSLDKKGFFFKEFNTAKDYESAIENYNKIQNSSENIKTIILSAGKGDRLKHFTENKPTGLLEINGKPILEYQLDALMKNGLKNIVIIIGYKGFMIKEFIENNQKFNKLNITFVENDEYLTAGTAYSWWLAKEHIKNEKQILHLHSDLLFDESLIKEIIEDKNQNVICVDSRINLDDSMEQVILDTQTKQIIYMDKRNIPSAHGKAAGIAKFSQEVINSMLNKIKAYHNLDDKQQAFYAIIRKTLKEYKFNYIDIEDKLFEEFNTTKDYQKTFFKKNIIETGIPEKNSVIMLYGLPATGKTTASRKIRDYFEKEMHVEVISTFKIREEKNWADLNSEEQREQVYDELCKILEDKLSKRIYKCLILDGNFNKKTRRKKVYDVVKRHNCDFYIVECLVNSEEKTIKRLEKRASNLGIEQKANTIELHKMIQTTGQELSMEEFSNPVPIIISYNSELNEAKLSPRQYIVKGIIDSLRNKSEASAEIIFIRHGETNDNIRGVLQGWSDASLNETGLKSAQELSLHLKNINFDEIYSSDLKRALQCAQEIQKYFPTIQIQKEPLLREKNFGEHQGKMLMENLGYPDNSYEFMVKHFYECSCFRGETNDAVIERIKKFLTMIKKKQHKKILVTTHGGIIMLLLNYLLKEKLTFDNRRAHKNGYATYVKLDENLNIKDSLINAHISEVANYIKNL